jgi:hypothetical protein
MVFAVWDAAAYTGSQSAYKTELMKDKTKLMERKCITVM